MKWPTWAKSLLVVFVIFALLLVLKWVIFWHSLKDSYEPFWAIKPGMSEQEVVERLGKPHKIYQKETAPENYYVEGYSYKKKKINGKVFIYIGGEPIAYIYFDIKNKVEDTFVGGS